jgi:predicted Zn-dependent peptidase
MLSAAIATLLAAVATPQPTQGAEGFSPPGLYKPEVYHLENGLQVVLAPREGAPSVAIRAVVGLGTKHFACPKEETPHFLEHLLFTGTSQHSEEELDLLISSHGGSWNASTGNWETIFEIDIFSGHAALGIETLHEIFTDTEISEQDVMISREVLLREAGAPSLAARLLDRSGLFRSANALAFERLMSPRISVCVPAPLATDVTHSEIEAAYQTYYVPANMSLVVVGDLEIETMRSAIARTFGSMPAAPLVKPPRGQLPAHPGAISLVGLGDQASVGIVFRTGGYLSEHHSGLWVLGTYLSKRLYQVLRVERGLTYTPSVSYSPSTDVGLFWISAEVDSANTDLARMLIDEEMDRIRDGDIDPLALERARTGILLAYARGFESNADVADYYVASLFELGAHGAFVDEEEMLKSLTVEAILEAGRATFAPHEAVSLRDRRLFLEEVLAGSAVGGVLAAVYVPWRVVRRGSRGQRRREALSGSSGGDEEHRLPGAH